MNIEFNINKAKKLQRLLSRSVVKEGRLDKLRLIVGLDVAYVGSVGIAVATLLDYPKLNLKEYCVVYGEVPIPYIPGLLAFREAPLLIKAYEKLGMDADLIIVDGHGITHPRGLGIASHIGVVLDVPTIGAAKKVLVGRITEIYGRKYLVVNGEPGALVYEVSRKHRVFLSIGHKVSLNEIVRIAPTLFKGHPLPEPTYIADYITKKERIRLAHHSR